MKPNKEDTDLAPRVFARDMVYAMGRASSKGWPEGREPTLEDFADRRWAVSESSVYVELQIMGMAPAVFLSYPTPYPQWYLFNGVVYSAPAFYHYVRAFYPSSESNGTWITNHFRKLMKALD